MCSLLGLSSVIQAYISLGKLYELEPKPCRLLEIIIILMSHQLQGGLTETIQKLDSGNLRIRNTGLSVQSLSRVRLFATPWSAARQASLCITYSQSLLKLMSIE